MNSKHKKTFLSGGFTNAKTSSHLTRAFYPFLIMISCFSVVTMINNTFLNTFLLHATDGSENVMTFNIILAICQPFSMIAALVLVRKISAIRSQQIGLILLAGTNLYLFLAVESAVANIYWISAFQSIANGFYFTTYACQYINYTTNENRDKAAGLSALISSALSLAFSLLSSLLFSLYPGYAGYKILFLMALIFSIAALAVSFRLAPLTTVNADRTIHYGYAAKMLWKNRYARSSMIITLIDGMRTGVMAFYLNILLYAMVESEALIGINTFVCMLSGIMASAVYARSICISTRYRSAQISISSMLVITLLLLIKLSPVIIILYGCANAFITPFYTTPLLNAYWTVLDKIPELNHCRPEVHAVRENYYAIGRVAGIMFTMLLPATNTGSVIAILSLIAVQYIGLLLAKKIMRNLDSVQI